MHLEYLAKFGHHWQDVGGVAIVTSFSDLLFIPSSSKLDIQIAHSKGYHNGHILSIRFFFLVMLGHNLRNLFQIISKDD
jgi:hypothetical protein